MLNSTIGAFCMFIFLAFFSSFSNAIAQSCNTELKVSKNRNARSANEQDATQFQLELANNSFSAQTYTLEVNDYQGTFLVRGKRPDRLNSTSMLKVSFLQNNVVKNSITVPARSTALILAQIEVLQGTPYNKWAGFEVKAFSNECASGTAPALLKLHITDPSEE